MRAVKFFDTTLRDGEQAPGNAMTVEQRVELSKEIDSTGVDYIESGFPSCSDADFEATRQISSLGLNATICAFARSTVEDIECAIRATETAKEAQIQLLLTGSEVHLEKKRHFTIGDAVEEARTAVRIAVANGAKNISLGCEDAGRGSIELLKRVIGTGLEEGANCVVIADTVGAVLPGEFETKIRTIREFIGSDVELSIHCHNDMGLAVANTLAGMIGGADTAQVTLCGIGERAGNTSIEELSSIIRYRGHELGLQSNIDHHKMVQACNQLVNFIDLVTSPQKPIIGKHVFSTAAGIHIKGMIQDPECYEYVRPEDYGREREFIISRLSGRSVIFDRLQQYGFSTNSEIVDLMYQTIIRSNQIDQYNIKEDFLDLYKQMNQLNAAIKIQQEVVK